MATTSTLRERYEKLSQDSFKAGMTQALYERGAAEIMSQLQFEGFRGDHKRFVVEKSKPGSSAARDPFDTNTPPGGVGDVYNIRIPAGQMSRNVDVPEAAANVMNDTNDQTQTNVQLASESFHDEFMLELFHGTGMYKEETGVTLSGLDWWLDEFAGRYEAGSFVQGSYHNTKFEEQKFFATVDGVDGPAHQDSNKKSLSLNMFDDARSRYRGRDFDMILSPRKTWVAFKNHLNASGGNTTNMLVGDRQVPGWDGLPWVVSDSVGSEKYVEEGGAISSSGNELTISNSNSLGFIGFSDLDVGRTVTVVGAGAGGADLVTKITQVDDRFTAQVADSAGTTVSNAAVTLDRTECAYLVRFNGANGIRAIHGMAGEASEQTYDVDMGDYYGSIAGYDLLDLGILQQGGNIRRYRMIWDGNFCVQDPYTVCRVSHYTL